MEIRLAEESDLDAVTAIYDKAREFMKISGNVSQWRPGYPSADTFRKDLAGGGAYVCCEKGRVVATFFFVIGEEPTYAVIREGEWLDSRPYGVIHRVATDGSVKGVMHKVLDFCFEMTDNIRIDTHRDNRVMQRSLKNYGFSYCGLITLPDGSERLAFQKRL